MCAAAQVTIFIHRFLTKNGEPRFPKLAEAPEKAPTIDWLSLDERA